MMFSWYRTSICVLHILSSLGLFIDVEKKLLLLYSFIHQLTFKMTLLTEISVPCRLTVVKGDAFVLKVPVKITETNT